MAEALKRDYDIVALKVEVLDRDLDVRFTLQFHEDGRLTSLEPWLARSSDLGLSIQDYRKAEDVAFQLPSDMLSGIRQWFAEHAELSSPLYVHLVKPYGALRLVPWERLLGQALGVPILMLPDFLFPPPRETADFLEVVLCGSAPLFTEDHWVRQALITTGQAILQGSPRAVRLHCFVDGALMDDVDRALHVPEGSSSRIVIHGPTSAYGWFAEDPTSRLVDKSGRLRSPWLLWMRDALGDTSVDVVHFVCHGHLTRKNGALLLAQSPLERTEQYLAGPIGQVELGTFLTQVGAWSTVFTSPHDNNSAAGLRALTDEVAQSRPGPAIMHDWGLDQGGEALRAAYQFVYGLEPTEPPRSDALFIYCQPYRVKGAIRDQDMSPWIPSSGTAYRDFRVATTLEANPSVRNTSQRDAVARSAEASMLDPLLMGRANAPTWIAATARFSEQVQLELQAAARDQLLPEEMLAHRSKLTHDFLTKLQASVAELASLSPERDLMRGPANPIQELPDVMGTAGGEA